MLDEENWWHTTTERNIETENWAAGAKIQKIPKENCILPFYRQSNIFRIDQKTFYRELGKEQVNMEKHLTKDKIEKIWEKDLGEWLNGSKGNRKDPKD